MTHRSRAHRHPAHRRPRARPTPAGRKGSDSLGWQQTRYLALQRVCFVALHIHVHVREFSNKKSRLSSDLGSLGSLLALSRSWGAGPVAERARADEFDAVGGPCGEASEMCENAERNESRPAHKSGSRAPS